MSKSKIFGMMALIVFTIGILLVGNAVAGESGKILIREVYYTPTVHTLKVPDMEGHTYILFEEKGIGFHEKWGNWLITLVGTGELKAEGTATFQFHVHYTFPDGSTITFKAEGGSVPGRGIIGEPSAEGTAIPIKGTGKFQGIQGRVAWKGYHLAPNQSYAYPELEYTLP